MSGCEKYAELMNRYLDGDLPASQISDLLDHLETCASCRNRFDALKIMAFEMRHMQVEPPAALHSQIMQSVRHSGQRRPRAYFKTAFAIAACAAAMVLAINGNFFQMADHYLFNNGNKSASAETAEDAAEQDAAPEAAAPAGGEAPAGEADGAAPQEAAPAAAPPSIAQDDVKRIEEPDLAAPFAPEETESPQTGQGGASSDQGTAGDTEGGESAKAAASEGPAANADAPAPRSAAVSPEQHQEAKEEGGGQAPQNQEANDQEANESQPFRIPPLDTDEVFAFYCVALGEGSIPNAFEQNEIVRFPDKNCMYIYVKTTQFTKKGCENLLSQSGFTIREGANLPETDESMPYGLVVIYGYEMK